MNVIESQMKLGQELFAINADVTRRMVEITGDAFRQTLEANQEYAQKLAEVRDFGAFVALQREYGQTMFSDAQGRLQTRGEVLKEAFERGSVAVRGAFSQEEAAEEAAA